MAVVNSLAIDVGRSALYTALLAALPAFVLAFAVGLLVGLVQVSTQIHEQTMVFVPKIVAVGIALWVFGPWILRTVVEFALSVLEMMPLAG